MGMLYFRVRRIAPITVSLLFGAGACVTAMKPPVVNSPASSKNGVEVAVLRQACSQTEPVDEVPTGSVDETVEIQVRNGSPEPLVVHPDRFRLLPADGTAPATVPSHAGEALTVAQGGTQTFEVEFTASGGLACTKAMRLDPDVGVTLRDAPVTLAPVPFRPL
jgi:hypothetical protein